MKFTHLGIEQGRKRWGKCVISYTSHFLLLYNFIHDQVSLLTTEDGEESRRVGPKAIIDLNLLPFCSKLKPTQVVCAGCTCLLVFISSLIV